MLYKVEKEEGVEVDGVHFAKGEILDFDPEMLEVSNLVAEGSLVEGSEEEEVTPSTEEETTPTETEEEAPEVETTESGTFYNGKKITGAVSDVEVEGVAYKEFTAGGETFKLTVEEFNASTEVVG